MSRITNTRSPNRPVRTDRVDEVLDRPGTLAASRNTAEPTHDRTFAKL